MIRFSVGYQFRRDSGWIDCILANRERVNEVFFAPLDAPNGRTGERVIKTEFSIYEKMSFLDRDLRRISDAGIGLNILYNAGCYGVHSRSSVFFKNTVETIRRYRERNGLSSMTTTSPFLAEVIKTQIPQIKVRASINMDVSSPRGMDYISEYFDGYYLKRELNRDMAAIRQAKAWCVANGKELLMLVNSGCLSDCSEQIFHNNLVAHGDELEDVDKNYPLKGCRAFLQRPGKLKCLIRDSNWVRPEDLHIYDGLFDSFKLATRVNRCPEIVLTAYVNGAYDGSILDLMEPDHREIMNGHKIDNKHFPIDFGMHVASCSKECDSCGYCERVFTDTYA